MTDFNNTLAGALRDDHVRATLIEELKKSSELADYVKERIKEDREARDAAEAAAVAARPPITSREFWLRSKVIGPVLTAFALVAAVTGLTASDMIQPRDLAHKVMGTNDRVLKIISGKSGSADSEAIGKIIEDNLVMILSTKQARAKGIKTAIRSTVTELPFLVFQGWQSLDLVPDNPVFSAGCSRDLALLDEERQQLELDVMKSNATVSTSSDGGERFLAMSTLRQAEGRLGQIGDERKTIFHRCIAELDDPEALFSFYADLERDSVRVMLRVLKYTSAQGLKPVSRSESEALTAVLTSVSLDRSSGAGGATGSGNAVVKLDFTGDGLLQATLTADNIRAVKNRNDPIYQLVVSLDREKIGQAIEGVSYVVASVVQLNRVDGEDS